MQQVLSATSKVIVDQKGGQNLLYLPLDRIMQLSAQQSSPTVIESPRVNTAPEVSSPPPMPVPEQAPSRRDSLRSRDREAGR
jgi:membrane protease subunit HflK